MPDTGAGRYEQRIAARLAAAGCRLRHDTVARRLIDGVKAGFAPGACTAGVIAFAVTAPIKQPAKTTEMLVQLLADVPADGLRATVHGNTVHARRLAGGATGIAGMFGFVHNPDYAGDRLLDLAARALHEE